MPALRNAHPQGSFAEFRVRLHSDPVIVFASDLGAGGPAPFSFVTAWLRGAARARYPGRAGRSALVADMTCADESRPCTVTKPAQDSTRPATSPKSGMGPHGFCGVNL
jgi:hypothetical protein